MTAGLNKGDISGPFSSSFAGSGNSRGLFANCAASILCGMRRLHNWSYRDVTDFLIANGFSFSKEIGGSHQAWSKKLENSKDERVVVVNFTHQSYPPRTIRTMVRQSG